MFPRSMTSEDKKAYSLEQDGNSAVGFTKEIIMPGLLHSLMAELKPQWVQNKQEETLAEPNEKQDDPPMPAPTWTPEIKEPPLEPESDEPEEIVPPVQRREIGDPKDTI